MKRRAFGAFLALGFSLVACGGRTSVEVIPLGSALDAGSAPDAGDPRCQISASSYDQGCAQDSDCVAVAEGNACVAGCGCPDGTAINVSAAAQYQAAWLALAPPSYHLCDCPRRGPPACCVQGKCQATSACETPRMPLPGPPTSLGPPVPKDVACWSPGPGDGAGPPVTDGPCTLVGTWSYVASAGSSGTLSFDAYGNWVGSGGADLCSSRSYWGTYTLTATQFTFVTIHNVGNCNPDWIMTKVPSFDATCTHAVLREQGDNCTGGRPEFNYDLTLTKLP